MRSAPEGAQDARSAPAAQGAQEGALPAHVRPVRPEPWDEPTAEPAPEPRPVGPEPAPAPVPPVDREASAGAAPEDEPDAQDAQREEDRDGEDLSGSSAGGGRGGRTTEDGDPRPSRGGRPAVMTARGRTRRYEPSEEDRRKVSTMVGVVGLTLDEIAVVMGVALSTLKEHYRDDIAAARANAVTSAAMRLFQIAMKDGHKDQFRSLKFWLQTRGRWSTTVNVNVTDTSTADADAAMLADLRKLPIEQLRVLEQIAGTLDEQASVAAERSRAAVSDAVEGRSGWSPSRN